MDLIFVTLSRANYLTNHHAILYKYFKEYGHEHRILFYLRNQYWWKIWSSSLAYIVAIVYCIVESSINDWHVIFDNNVFELSLYYLNCKEALGAMGWNNIYILFLGESQIYSYVIFSKSIFYSRDRAVKWFGRNHFSFI